MRPARRVAVLAASLVMIRVGLLLAHAALLRSDPARDARLPLPPRIIHLEFSERVTAATSRIELIGPDSQQLRLIVKQDSGNAKALLADVPALPARGVYRVEWRLVGPDGHAVTGRYAFTIDSIPVSFDSVSSGVSSAPQEKIPESSADSLLQRVIRFFSFLSMVVVIGSVAFALFVLPAAARPDGNSASTFGQRVDERLRVLAVAGAWSLLILAVVRLTSYGVVLSGSLDALRLGDLTDLVTGSTWGRGWMLQVAATIALLFWLRAGKPVRWSAMTYVVGALAISASFFGHPAAVADAAGLAMILDAVHVLAAGGWVGAIIMLAVAALPLVPSVPADQRVETVRSLLRAFTPLALSCAAILVVTGAIGGWLQLRDVGLILGSDYGLALVRKVIVVLIIVALGAYHWRVVQPSVAGERAIGRLRASLVLDVGFVFVVLLLTAVLTGTTPPVR